MTMILGAIAWLTERRQRIDQAIEILQQLVGETATPAAPAPVRKTNGTPVKPKAAARQTASQRPQNGSTAHRVAKLLKSHGPLSPREIRQTADMTSTEVAHALKVLSTRKLVTSSGSTTNRRYEVAGNFDVIWSGTAERNGDAPSLLGDRAQRSAS